MESATDEFEYSEDFAEDALPDRIDFDQIPVDMENPGFASLLPALLGVAQGQYDPSILEAYLAGLAGRSVDFEVTDALAKLLRFGIAEEREGHYRAIEVEVALERFDATHPSASPFAPARVILH